MYSSVKETAEKILGRPLKAEEGLPLERIEAKEKQLMLKLPNILREFHMTVGSITILTNATERFIPLDKIRSVDKKLVFAESEDGIAYWGINLSERYNKNAAVYLCVEEEKDNRIWFNDEVGLTEFIHSTMYYKYAHASYEYNHYLGNYSFTGVLPLEKGEKSINSLIDKLELEWEKVVNRKNLIIYWRNGQMIWFFTNSEGKPDEMIMLSSQTEESYINMLKEFGFYKDDSNKAKAAD